MKPIFITQRLTEIKEYSEERECLDIRWATFLQKCGLLPIALPINCDVSDYWQCIKPKGLLLTGGNNLECCQAEDDLNKKRDAFEQKLIIQAIKENIPILGVCRGMQMLAWYFGSTFGPVKNHVAVSHPIVVDGESVFHPFYMNEIFVNSYHDFAVFEESKEFVARVWSRTDQCIEGMSSLDNKIAGIMWHPERESPFSKCDVAFFKSFFSSK